MTDDDDDDLRFNYDGNYDKCDNGYDDANVEEEDDHDHDETFDYTAIL
jgi:hypothetical protein